MQGFKKDKLLVMLIFTALTTKNGLRSEAPRGRGAHALEVTRHYK